MTYYQSPGNSPSSSGHNTALQRRADLLSPEHAERRLPIAMPVQIPYINIFSGSRNKPQPPAPKHARGGEQDQERPLTPLPELELAGLATTDAMHAPHPHSRAHRHAYAQRQEYEAAPVPDGIEYPASPLVGRPARRRGTLPTKGIQKEGGDAPLSPLVVASGLSGLKGRLMPWRRNTAK
jgi:hypothetical protein